MHLHDRAGTLASIYIYIYIYIYNVITLTGLKITLHSVYYLTFAQQNTL